MSSLVLQWGDRKVRVMDVYWGKVICEKVGSTDQKFLPTTLTGVSVSAKKKNSMPGAIFVRTAKIKQQRNIFNNRKKNQ